MSATPLQPTEENIATARAVVLRGGMVVTMDQQHTVLPRADVLIVGEQIKEIGPDLQVPEGTVEIDAAGGIVMPGMIDTHRHMWQTAMRGYGADWTLTQYFVWNYLEHGIKFRPQDIYAGNLLSAIEAVDAGVTTSVDWSHGLATIDHAEAAVDALQEIPARFVFAYGNIHAAPWEWSTSADFRSFVQRRMPRSEMLGFQLAFDVTGDPEFPERAAFEAARELGAAVTTHAGVWGATNDNGIRLMHEHGFMTPETVYVHAASLSDDSYQRIAATGGHASVSAESECSCGQGYPSSWALRRHGVPLSISVDTTVWFSADAFSAMRATLSTDRAREHHEAHAKGETVTHLSVRAEDVVDWATRGGARALGMDHLVGSLEPGKKADVVLIKNDHSPAMFPVLHPYGHIVFQAQRADVHTVVINGRVLKYDGRLQGIDLEKARTTVSDTVNHLREALGEQEWNAGMNPEIPESKVLDNPYTYTDYADSSTHSA